MKIKYIEINKSEVVTSVISIRLALFPYSIK